MINISRIKQGIVGHGKHKMSLSEDGMRRSNAHLLQEEMERMVGKQYSKS